MRVHICAVGRLRKGPERDLYDDYLTRFDRTGRALALGPAQLIEVEDKKGCGMAAEAELLARAKTEAARIAAAAAAEAEVSAERRKQLAMQRIAAAEASAIAEVRNTAADIAAAAARSVLAETIDAATDGAMIDRSVADLPRALRVA